MFQLIYVLLHWLIQVVQPLLVPVCFVLAWALVILLFWSVWAAGRDAIASSKRMHQIPCAHCRFFTHDYHLKCPVHPQTALSDAAIDCPDYEATCYSSLVERVGLD